MHWIGITTKMLLLIQAQREDYCRYPKLKQSLTIDIENYCALIFGEKKRDRRKYSKIAFGEFYVQNEKNTHRTRVLIGTHFERIRRGGARSIFVSNGEGSSRLELVRSAYFRGDIFARVVL